MGNNKELEGLNNRYAEIKPFKMPPRYVLLAKKLKLIGENGAELSQIMTRFLIEKDPKTETENILCEKIIIFLWKLQRAREIERSLLNQENEITEVERYDRDSFGSKGNRKRVRNIKKVRIGSPEIQNIIHYQFELEKSLDKAQKKLKEEQASRATTQND